MRVVINQPNYVPWRGYFDLIRQADLFVIFDDVQYTTRDWRNRNQIKTKDGKNWLTVNIHKVTRETLIKDVRVNYAERWDMAHKNALKSAYGKAPFFEIYAPSFFDILDRQIGDLTTLNIETIKWAMTILDIHTPIVMASSLNVDGAKTRHLLNILQKTGGTDYLSGPAAKSYIDEQAFRGAGIGLEWMAYDYDPYPQFYGDFDGAVSILDLIFQCGADAKNHIVSKSSNHRAV